MAVLKRHLEWTIRWYRLYQTYRNNFLKDPPPRGFDDDEIDLSSWHTVSLRFGKINPFK
jgi:hypothetical protein